MVLGVGGVGVEVCFGGGHIAIVDVGGFFVVRGGGGFLHNPIPRTPMSRLHHG